MDVWMSICSSVYTLQAQAQAQVYTIQAPTAMLLLAEIAGMPLVSSQWQPVLWSGGSNHTTSSGATYCFKMGVVSLRKSTC